MIWEPWGKTESNWVVSTESDLESQFRVLRPLLNHPVSLIAWSSLSRTGLRFMFWTKIEGTMECHFVHMQLSVMWILACYTTRLFFFATVLAFCLDPAQVSKHSSYIRPSSPLGAPRYLFLWLHLSVILKPGTGNRLDAVYRFLLETAICC